MASQHKPPRAAETEDANPTSLATGSTGGVVPSTMLLPPSDSDEYRALERKLVRKVDWRLMPVLVVMIILNYLDRQALPNARVQGIEKDLGLKGDDYNVAISVLFAGYIALQIPSNMLLTRVRPSIYLPVCMALWGAVSACTAAVRGFQGLVVCRFFLGFLEAPFFPGALFLLSAWYTPRELATRTAVLYTGSLLSGGFGGLVGAGIQYGLSGDGAAGRYGLHTWQWLFILEGAATVFLSVLSVFLLPDFPATTRWLSAPERALAMHRMSRHSGSADGERGPLLRGVRMAVADYKVWLLAAVVVTKTTAAAVTSFIPTLVAAFGYASPVQSLLMTAPPYVFAAAVAMAISVSSDRLGERYFHLVVPLAVGMVGYIIAAATTALAPRYFSLFLMLGGVYGSFNVTYAWISSTLPRPVEKRAAAFAFTNMVGNFAQIYSPYMYGSASGPRYLPAMTANTVFVFASICFATTLRFCLVRENRKLEALEAVQQGSALENDGHNDPKARDEIVQRGPGGLPLVFNPGFRYAL